MGNGQEHQVAVCWGEFAMCEANACPGPALPWPPWLAFVWLASSFSFYVCVSVLLLSDIMYNALYALLCPPHTQTLTQTQTNKMKNNNQQSSPESNALKYTIGIYYMNLLYMEHL